MRLADRTYEHTGGSGVACLPSHSTCRWSLLEGGVSRKMREGDGVLTACGKKVLQGQPDHVECFRCE